MFFLENAGFLLVCAGLQNGVVGFAFLAKTTITPKGGAVQSFCGAKIVSGMSWIDRMLESRDFGPISLSFAQGFTFPFLPFRLI